MTVCPGSFPRATLRLRAGYERLVATYLGPAKRLPLVVVIAVRTPAWPRRRWSSQGPAVGAQLATPRPKDPVVASNR